MERLARTVALAVIIAIGIFNVYMAVTHWDLLDANAYWQAGLRLRAGEPLYPALTSAEGSEIYRYAPWFAWLAVPWTYLPEVGGGCAVVRRAPWRVRAGADAPGAAAGVDPGRLLRPDPGRHQRRRQCPAIDRGGTGAGRRTAERAAVDRAGGVAEDLSDPAGAGLRRPAAVVGLRRHGGHHVPALVAGHPPLRPERVSRVGRRGWRADCVPDPLLRGRGHRHGRNLRPGADAVGLAGRSHRGRRLAAAPVRVRRDVPDGWASSPRRNPRLGSA